MVDQDRAAKSKNGKWELYEKLNGSRGKRYCAFQSFKRIRCIYSAGRIRGNGEAVFRYERVLSKQHTYLASMKIRSLW